MKHAETGSRLLLALALTIFGLDKFLGFMGKPAPPPEGGAFLGALGEAGYLFPTIGVVFLATAACLVLGRVTLGLLLLAPIEVNILLYHIRFDLPGIAPGAVIAALMAVLAFLHCGEILKLLRKPAAD